MGMFEPVSFSAFGLTVYGYGLAAAVGFLLMWLVLCLRRGRSKMDRVWATEMMLWAVPLAVFTGRAVYCLFRPGSVFFDAVDGAFLGIRAFFTLTRGGLDYFGMLFGLLLSTMIAAKRLHMPLPEAFDRMAAPAAPFLCVLRFALRLAGEGYGEMLEEGAKPLVPFVMQNAYEEWHLAVYFPEGIAMLAVFLLVLLLPLRAGRRAPAMVAMTAACQMFFEALHRDNYLRMELNGFIRADQVLAMLTLILVLVWLFRHETKERRRGLMIPAALLPAAVAFAVAAEFYEKLPLPTPLLYGLSALGSLALAFALTRHCMEKN